MSSTLIEESSVGENARCLHPRHIHRGTNQAMLPGSGACLQRFCWKAARWEQAAVPPVTHSASSNTISEVFNRYMASRLSRRGTRCTHV